MISSEQFRQVCSGANLRQAWLRVEESDGGPGIDGVSLERFADGLTAQLERLEKELSTGTYCPLPMLRFFVPKSDGGQRALNIATVRDRSATISKYGAESRHTICL